MLQSASVFMTTLPLSAVFPTVNVDVLAERCMASGMISISADPAAFMTDSMPCATLTCAFENWLVTETYSVPVRLLYALPVRISLTTEI